MPEQTQKSCAAPAWWPERCAQNPIPSRTRPLNTPAPMVLCLKTRESRSPPGLPSTRHTHSLTQHAEDGHTPSGVHAFGAGWSSPVARQAHNLKVAGSNPAPATNAYTYEHTHKLTDIITDDRKPAGHHARGLSVIRAAHGVGWARSRAVSAVVPVGREWITLHQAAVTGRGGGFRVLAAFALPGVRAIG